MTREGGLSTTPSLEGYHGRCERISEAPLPAFRLTRTTLTMTPSNCLVLRSAERRTTKILHCPWIQQRTCYLSSALGSAAMYLSVQGVKLSFTLYSKMAPELTTRLFLQPKRICRGYETLHARTFSPQFGWSCTFSPQFGWSYLALLSPK